MDSREHQAERALLPLLRRRRGVPILLCVGLLLGIAAAYWPVLGHQFLNYDDPEYVTANPAVRAGLNWAGIKWAFTTYHAGNWHPVTWLSHMLDVQLFGLNPGAHHLVNVLFHAANSLLLFLLLRRITGALWRSALVAALFAWHPLHVESVAWVAERKDVLSTFFFMLTLLAYAKYAGSLKSGPGNSAFRIPHSELGSSEIRIPHSELGSSAIRIPQSALESPSTLNPQRSTHWYVLSLMLFALGLMSKPMLVTLPCVLLLLDFWPLGRLRLSFTSTPPGPSNPSFPRSSASLWWLLLEKLPFLACSTVCCAVTYAAQGAVAMVGSAVAPATVRFVNALLSYATYLKKAVLPTKLAAYYPFLASNLEERTLLAVLTLASVSLVVVVCLRRRPYLLVGWLWYLGTLVPVIGFVQAGGQAMADRYTYIPLIGIFIAAVWLTSDRAGGCRYRQALLLSLGCIVLGTFLTATALQVRVWRDSETLFRRTLAVTVRNAHAHVNLGETLADQGKLEEAAHEFAEAASIAPPYPDAEVNLALTLVLMGRYGEAIPHYQVALKAEPRSATEHLLGRALLAQGKFLEAIGQFRRALQLDGNSIEACNDLAWALATAPKPENRNGPEACRFAERACQMTGFEQPQFLGTLAAAYAEAGRFEDAVRIGEKARGLALVRGQKELAHRNDELLQLYKAQRPFHQPPER